MSQLLDLRAALTSILASQLGTYTLANGSQTPAVRCSDPSETRYPGTVVEGIELVILKQPDLVPVRQYSNEFVIANWTAFIVAWNDDKTAGTSAQLVINAIPGCTYTQVALPEGIGPRDQVRLTIPTPANALPLDALIPGAEVALNDLITDAGDELVTDTGDNISVGAFV